MRIYVDGQLDAEGFGPSGNIDYRIGAEKHDYDRNFYPSYSGWNR